MTERARLRHPPSTSVTAALWLGVRSMWRQPWLAVAFLIATLIQGAVQGLLIWALRAVLESFGKGGGVAMGALIAGALVIFAIWLFRSLSTFIALLLSMHLSYRVEIASMTQVLSKLLMLSVRFFDKSSRGDVVMSAYYDLKGIRAVTLQVGQVVLYVAQFAGLGAAAWVMSPKLALIGFLLVPVGVIPAYWFGDGITRGAHKERGAVN